MDKDFIKQQEQMFKENKKVLVCINVNCKQEDIEVNLFEDGINNVEDRDVDYLFIVKIEQEENILNYV